jgi:hypothetical protein
MKNTFYFSKVKINLLPWIGVNYIITTYSKQDGKIQITKPLAPRGGRGENAYPTQTSASH